MKVQRKLILAIWKLLFRFILIKFYKSVTLKDEKKKSSLCCDGCKLNVLKHVNYKLLTVSCTRNSKHQQKDNRCHILTECMDKNEELTSELKSMQGIS